MINSCDEYKNLIDKIFKFGFMNGDLYLTNFDNKELGMTKIVNKYSGKNNDVLMDCLILKNPLKIQKILTIK